MQIVALDARIVRIPLRRPVKHASHQRRETDNLIVRCTLSDGSVGWGEGVPRDYVTGETAETSLQLLKGIDRTQLEKACPNFEAVIHLAERLKLPAVPGDDRLCQGNAARCALELAILDAFGRAYGEPMMNITRLLAPDLYQPRERVQYSGVIMSAKGWKARMLALMYRVMGFRQVKVKVGISGHHDAKRLRAIRRVIGSGVELRVDANEAWTPEDLVERIQELEQYGIVSVEQPLPHEKIAEVGRLRGKFNTPILLDESLCSEVDAERALRGKYGDRFNLRLSKCGGFIPTLRLAEFARRNGLGYQLGCQVGESAILSAAGRQFACSVDGILAREGSFDRHLVVDSLSSDDITFGRGGWAPMLTGSGHSVSIDPARVEARTIQREVLIG